MAQAVDQLERDMQKAARDLAGTQPARLGARARRLERHPAERNQDAHAVFGALHSRRAGPVDGAARSPHHAVAGAVEPRPESRAGGRQSQRPARRATRTAAWSRNWRAWNACAARCSRWQQRVASKTAKGRPRQGRPRPRGKAQQGGQGQGQGQGQQVDRANKAAGQQGGGAAAAGRGRQRAADACGGGYGGNGFGRFQPEGIYEPNGGPGPIEPGNLVRDAQAQMNDLRDRVQGDPDLSREVQDLSRDLSRLSVGNTASAELEARIAREILPKLEALEVQLRRSVGRDLESRPSAQRRRRPCRPRLHRRGRRVLPQAQQGPIITCYPGTSQRSERQVNYDWLKYTSRMEKPWRARSGVSSARCRPKTSSRKSSGIRST